MEKNLWTSYSNQMLQRSLRSKSQNIKVKCIHVRLNVYTNSFFPFNIGLWNNVLPVDLVNKKNENKFKSKLLNTFFEI